jgi:hypothetical protein
MFDHVAQMNDVDRRAFGLSQRFESMKHNRSGLHRDPTHNISVEFDSYGSPTELAGVTQ